MIPTIEIAPPVSWCGLDAALTTLRTFDWLVFTSANAVHAFAQRARTLALAANPRKIAAIGSATAHAIEEFLSRTADLIPSQAVAESLAQALAPHAAGASILLVRAAMARDVLPETLAAAGALVTIAEAYRNVVPEGAIDALHVLFAERPPDAVTFTSASTAFNLYSLISQQSLTLPAVTVLASIGPITSAALRNLGVEPTVEAADATIPSLVEALADHFAKRL